jgi:hypothetical protein
MKTIDSDMRLCREDGEQPTTRERWTAFYRLWRLIKNARSAQEVTLAGEPFRVLMNDWRWIQLVEAYGDELELKHGMPWKLRMALVTEKRQLKSRIFA